MKVVLLRYTEHPEELVASAARVCYSDKSIEEIVDMMSDPEESAKLIRMLYSIGHTSVFEHITFTFAIEGVSRVLSHQLVRHRVASYSQRSQRYVNEDGFTYIIPPSIIKAGPEAEEDYDNLMMTINHMYHYLIEKYDIPKEDSRYVLPTACTTNIACTFNARSLFNFFNLRCCTRAQWEIRELANQMLKLVREVAPTVFAKAGPSCVTLGYCPEGEKSCGRYPTLTEIQKRC